MGTKHFITAARAEQRWDRMDWVTNELRPSIPGWLIDQLATEKLTGGYAMTVTSGRKIGGTKKKVSNRCDGCYQLKSVNGTCGCYE